MNRKAADRETVRMTSKGSLSTIRVGACDGLLASGSRMVAFSRARCGSCTWMRRQPDPVSRATQTPETQLQTLGSLRKNDPGDPAAGKTSPKAVPDYPFLSESLFGIGGPAAAVRSTPGAK